MSFITVFFEANISALKNKQRKNCIYAQKQLNKGLHLLYVSFMSLLYLIISVRKMVNIMASPFKCFWDSQWEMHVLSLFHCVALQLLGESCKTGIYSE